MPSRQLLFALLVVEELDSDVGDTIFTVAAWTVLVSIFAHGLTARAWVGHLARRLDAADRADAGDGRGRRNAPDPLGNGLSISDE